MPRGAVIGAPSALRAGICVEYVFPCEILYLARPEVIYVIGHVLEIDWLQRASRLEVLKKDVGNSREDASGGNCL